MSVLAVPVWETVAQDNTCTASAGLREASIKEAAATIKFQDARTF